jgi:hypothetical protein
MLKAFDKLRNLAALQLRTALHADTGEAAPFGLHQAPVMYRLDVKLARVVL